MNRYSIVFRVAIAGIALSLAAQSSAALILYEPFDYDSNEGLAGMNGQGGVEGVSPPAFTPHGQVAPNGNFWMATAYNGFVPYNQVNDAVTSATDLSYRNLLHTPSGSVQLGGQGMSPRLAFSAINNDSVNGSSVNAYYSFVFRITSLAGTDPTGGLIAGFNNTRGSQASNPGTVGAAVYAKASGAGFVMGVLEQGTDAMQASYDTNVLNFNQDYFVVGKYTINGTFNINPTNDDTAQIWINPTSLGGADPANPLIAVNQRVDVPTRTDDPGGGNRTIQSFLLRQNRNVATSNTQSTVGNLFIDELRIGNTYADVTPIPEPSTFALIVLMGGMMSGFRRRL